MRGCRRRSDPRRDSRSRIVEVVAADTLVVEEGAIEAEPDVQRVRLLDLVGHLREQLVVLEGLFEVAGSRRRSDRRNRHPARPFVREEIVRAILHQRPAEPATGLLLLEAGLRRGECVSRVQRLVAMEVVDAAVRLVGAGPRDRIENQPAGVAELRGILRRQHLELLDGVGRRVGADRVGRHPLVADAVDDRLAAAARLAVGGHRLLRAVATRPRRPARAVPATPPVDPTAGDRRFASW